MAKKFDFINLFCDSHDVVPEVNDSKLVVDSVEYISSFKVDID